ncbi:MAG: rane protein-like protein [Bryobacterales bacterium]|jgi:uncharacterized membrane protein|nr:rane protein-like protein [Bryobacterales bacterium]
MRFRYIRRGLIAAYVIMWFGGVFGPPNPPAWASPLFLLLSAAIVSVDAAEVWPLILFAIGGFAAEAVGVHTGVPFGRYSYSQILAPSAGGVPLAIACAWLTLLAAARDIAWRFAGRRWVAVLAGAALMTAADLLIDPVATRVLHFWTWHQPGIFYGVPLVNFAGWFGVSCLLLAIAGRPQRGSGTAPLVGLSVLVFFAIAAMGR